MSRYAELHTFVPILVTSVTGDTVVSDDGTNIAVDYVEWKMGPILDEIMPGWRGQDLVMAVALMPGDGLAVADGVQLATPHAYASCDDGGEANVRVFNSAIKLGPETDPVVRMQLIAGAEAGATLDAARAHRVVVLVGQREAAQVADPFTSLPETFTSDLAA